MRLRICDRADLADFTHEIIERCKARDVTTVFDLLDLEDDDRTQLLGLSAREMRGVAAFCNAFPSLADTVFEVEDADKLDASTPISVKVTLERELDEDDDGEAEIDTTVVAPLYPLKKQECVAALFLFSDERQGVLGRAFGAVDAHVARDQEGASRPRRSTLTLAGPAAAQAHRLARLQPECRQARPDDRCRQRLGAFACRLGDADTGSTSG